MEVEVEVDKIITKTESQKLAITGITLLSLEEYDTYRARIPLLDDCWWLRSPGDDGGDYASIVKADGSGLDIGSYVDYDKYAVRPALQISNLGTFEIGDKFKLGGQSWTVISKSYALCDDIIGKCAFRKDWGTNDANDYEASDVKKFIEKWYQENILN